jgi:glycosyltransferase involved in cell wall biosynthesis
MITDKLRFAAVTSHPIQHFSPFFRELARVTGIDVKVFYLCDHGIRESYDPGFGQSFAWDVPLLDGYKYEILKPGFSPKKFGFFETDSPKLGKRLDNFSPHVIWIHGYSQMSSWRALQWAKNRSAIIYFGDSELVHKRSLSTHLIKYLPLRYFFRNCDAFLTIGDRNEEYYLHYGVPKEKFYRGAYPVDFQRFKDRLNQSEKDYKVDIRSKLRIPEEGLVAMVIGKLIPIKRQRDLVEAVDILKKRGISIYAVLIGDGPNRNELESCAKRYNISEYVKITGFINQKSIPFYIGAGDIVVMPSEKDPHPLAITESLIFGLPVVASDRVGCVGPTDTARPGVNALVYPCGDVDALADTLLKLVVNPDLREKMGKASLEIAPTQDVHTVVRAVIKICLSLYTKQYTHAWQKVDNKVFNNFNEYLGK